IPLLADFFLKASNSRNDKNVRMTRGFLDLMTDYDWPGNVRELQNMMERLVILSTGDMLSVQDLPGYFLQPPNERIRQYQHREEPPPPPSYRITELRSTENNGAHRSLQELEREQVEAALKRHGWVQARAARELGLTQRQIGYRMKKFNLQRPPLY
ncbi:MAG: AAA family ATPase, partial [Candidatus Electrothrix sp. AUS1_2]|nr:AAA family ATPase [Candidatus Electrothrix sp. AUS1_2]